MKTKPLGWVLHDGPAILQEEVPEHGLHLIGIQPPCQSVAAGHEVGGHPLGHAVGIALGLDGRDGLVPVPERPGMDPEHPQHSPCASPGIPGFGGGIDDPDLLQWKVAPGSHGEGDLPAEAVAQDSAHRTAQGPESLLQVMGGGLHRVGRVQVGRASVTPQVGEDHPPVLPGLHEPASHRAPVSPGAVDPRDHHHPGVRVAGTAPDEVGVEDGLGHGLGIVVMGCPGASGPQVIGLRRDGIYGIPVTSV
jgi:hypothetical protein